MAYKTTVASGLPIPAKMVWYMIQATNAALGSDATLPAAQTDTTFTMGGDSIDEQTKFGRVLAKASSEETAEITQYFVPNDQAIQMLIDAKREGRSLKFWRVIVADALADPQKTGDEAEDTARQYPARFGYGLISDDLEFDESADGYIEVNYTLDVIGETQPGNYTLLDSEVAALKAAYEYQNPGDTTGDILDGPVEGTTTTTTTTQH